MVKWIPVALYVFVSSVVLVAVDRQFDLNPNLVLAITAILIALAGFFSPDHPYRRAGR